MKIGWYFPLPHIYRISRPFFSLPYNYDYFLPSTWIRCLQLIPELEKLGITSILNKKKANCDIAIFLRDFSPPVQDVIQYQRANGARIAIDLCTNPFDVTGVIENGYGMTEEYSLDTLAAIGKSDSILCASSFITDRAKDFSTLAVHLPDSVDTKHYCRRKSVTNTNSTTLRVAWAGTASKAHCLKDILPELGRQNIALEIISDKIPALDYPFHFTKWSYQSSPESLLKGDVAISPRTIANPYDLGHSHFKIAVFMAQGIPAIASPLPSYEELVNKTRGGIIARTAAEWRTALTEIQHDKTLLRRMGEASYSGMRKFSTEVIAAQYVKFCETLLAHRSTR
jgi:hypothetical protein